jgi:hypothetical protein
MVTIQSYPLVKLVQVQLNLSREPQKTEVRRQQSKNLK